MRPRILAAVTGMGLLALPGVAAAGDTALLSALSGGYGPVETNATRVEGADPTALQNLYDAARDLDEALRAAAPVSDACAPLLAAGRAYALARVHQAEGADRPSPAQAAAGRRDAEAARERISRAAQTCTGGGGGRLSRGLPMRPSSGEAFFGAVVARAPRRADIAEVLVNGQVAGSVAPKGGRVRFVLGGAPGRYDIALRFGSGGRPLGSAAARGVWRLPDSGRAARAARATDGARSRRLARVGVRFGGYAGVWTQDLRTGRAAGWNAGARFPAASTVKLALMVGAFARLGSHPERSPLYYDLRQIALWSSNLATNRLLVRLGGSESGGASIAQGVLARLGASSSTFTGAYIVGTDLQPAMPAGEVLRVPPSVSGRVTTARDMARLLYAVHAAAVGQAAARAETGLTTHKARLILGLLLSSQQIGDNRSVVAGGVPPGTPVAQKNGWLRAARHGAAIVYGPRGPRIVVVMTYRDGGLSREAGAALGEAFTRVALG